MQNKSLFVVVVISQRDQQNVHQSNRKSEMKLNTNFVLSVRSITWFLLR